jgi:hypothetical protein
MAACRGNRAALANSTIHHPPPKAWTNKPNVKENAKNLALTAVGPTRPFIIDKRRCGFDAYLATTIFSFFVKVPASKTWTYMPRTLIIMGRA